MHGREGQIIQEGPRWRTRWRRILARTGIREHILSRQGGGATGGHAPFDRFAPSKTLCLRPRLHSLAQFHTTYLWFLAPRQSLQAASLLFGNEVQASTPRKRELPRSR